MPLNQKGPQTISIYQVFNEIFKMYNIYYTWSIIHRYKGIITMYLGVIFPIIDKGDNSMIYAGSHVVAGHSLITIVKEKLRHSDMKFNVLSIPSGKIVSQKRVKKRYYVYGQNIYPLKLSNNQHCLLYCWINHKMRNICDCLRRLGNLVKITDNCVLLTLYWILIAGTKTIDLQS